jgi:hypothetical protein
VTTPLPPVLPDRLSAYAPGRIQVVDPSTWPFDDGFERTGVPTTIPRYGFHVVTCQDEIDPDRVRWLVERATTRPLSTRHAHLAISRGIWHLVKGHHALAAHLITNRQQLPVRLVRPRATLERGDDLQGIVPGPKSPALA